MNNISNIDIKDHLDNMNNLDIDNLNIMESSDIIKKQVNEIIGFCIKKENSILRKERIDEYKQLCMTRFTHFHQKYPTLFFSIIENPSSFPLYRLDEMLNLKRKIENNEINEEKASVNVGRKYYDEFVKDTVSVLDKKINR